jgi:hypothetical protein
MEEALPDAGDNNKCTVTFEVSALYVWYAFLCAVAMLNLHLLVRRWKTVEAVAKYQETMKVLAIPWVFECAWRSVFPSLYLERFVFWDTW